MSAVISRVFINGNSQAIRIPQEFRLNVSRVQISRNEQGDLVIHPIAADRGAALLQALQGFDDTLTDEFVQQLSEDRLAQSPTQERDAL
jgi:antitoxin VapB